MAVSRYVVVADTTVPAGTAAAPVAGEPATGGAAGYGSAATTGGPLWATAYARGQVIVLDPAGSLYAAIIAAGGTLRAFTDGTDAAGRPGISN
jgi:hypothetical protein